jgi:hypothetical protein
LSWINWIGKFFDCKNWISIEKNIHIVRLIIFYFFQILSNLLN